MAETGISETSNADRASLYRLMSWLSPSYPVGAFAYSHGLEAAVEAGRVSDAGDLHDWIATVLRYGTGNTDGVLFREAWDSAMANDQQRFDTVSELASAFQPTAEIALEARSQGQAFLRATRNAWPAPMLLASSGSLTYPIAVALACADHGISVEGSLHAYYHAFAANLVSAGVRLIPLGQSDGQAVLARLEPTVAAAQLIAMTCSIDDLGSANPVIDLDSMIHETQYTRLFRS